MINELKVGYNSTNACNSLMGENGHTIETPSAIAEEFNKFFANIGKKLSQNFVMQSPESTMLWSLDYSMRLSPTTAHEIEAIIGGLKDKSSCGYDSISNSVLKAAQQVIAPYISHLINLSFRMGSFPSELARATVIPLHKKGSKTVVNNYRPISLLSSFSKIYERAMYNRLYDFLESNQILDC